MGQGVKTKKKAEMVDWWAGTVGLTFSPIFFSLIMSLIIYAKIDVQRLLGDGEVVLAAFLITSSSLISYYKDTHKASKYKRNFYLLLLVACLLLIAYTCIKVSPNCKPAVAYVTSILSVGTSLVTSYQFEVYLQVGDE